MPNENYFWNIAPNLLTIRGIIFCPDGASSIESEHSYKKKGMTNGHQVFKNALINS